ncbi:kinesin-like protein KIFC2 isoform X10 [Pteropus medius]|uniref:kinesin-like protein KIFC2 isoform X10 n=1 Tax=Pteropus vampyrus TaxID=132908 RepID=UPI00196B8716|nr:kinesin-like protein KIFC2 isoform X10 [Pteropus giganteus]
MYAFYSLLIYIFYSLFRRDGGAAAAADPRDPAQSARCKTGGRRRAPDQSAAELWTELTGLVGCSESEDGSGRGAEGGAAEVSLEEALVRLAEFLSVQLGAEESCEYPLDLSKPGDVPPLLTMTGQLLALLAWIRIPRGRQAPPQGIQPASGAQAPTPAGPTSLEESPSLSLRGEAQGQQPPQLEEDQRAWQRLEQLILGQLEELRQQLELQELELGRLRLGVGATDSEKRVQRLTLENEALKQSLTLTQDLLRHWGPSPSARAPQEEAEALVALQGQLQEAQDTTEALRVQLGVQEVQLQGLRGALRQLQQETEQNCRRELRQVHGQLAGLRAHMASLRRGCGDLRGLVSTFTQSCQGSLSEARGQVSWALGALSASGAGTQLPQEQQGSPSGCPGRLLELKGLQGAGAHCAVLSPRLQCLHFHLWSDGDREDLQHGGGKGPPSPRASRASGCETGPSKPGRNPGGWPHLLGRAQPGDAAPGTLHLVDLAGSERAWKAGAVCSARGDPDSAQRLREARTINRSLLALGGVMAALRARRPHVPFRDSQLTRLLQPALGPGATAVLLLQISTRPEDLGETVCSLKFAERVGQVELGPAQRRRAPRSGTPSSLSTDTPLTGTPCTPTPSPGSPPSPGPDSGSSSALAPPEDLPS